MDRRVKDATTERFYYDGHDQLRRHPADFIDAKNCGRRLKTLKGHTPYEFVCKLWTNQSKRTDHKLTAKAGTEQLGLSKCPSQLLSQWLDEISGKRSFPLRDVNLCQHARQYDTVLV